MEQVFAPWRIEWIEREEQNPGIEECVFCELPGRGADRESRIVARSEHSFVLLNNAPYNPGHVMVIPYRHTGEYTDLGEEELLDHARLTQRTIEAFDRAFAPDGVNTGCNLGRSAGGSIRDHLHTHVVPRWEGDTNFMPVIGETKVIVEGLSETYDRLHEAFAAADGATVTDRDRAVRFG
ncbi:HIT family protein [Natronorarus salvus]|uniref:HIT family protein n=1 Tax=Natronorarus salvus TaxID=3117733 RepID=UPI002F263958